MEAQRTENTPPGRGGSIYSTWDLEKAKDTTPRFGPRKCLSLC